MFAPDAAGMSPVGLNQYVHTPSVHCVDEGLGEARTNREVEGKGKMSEEMH